MFVFEQKGWKEVLRASPRSCMSRAGGTFCCGFSWSSATPGAHLESAACYLQLLGNSCVPCLLYGIWLVGSEGSLRMGLPWEVPRLTPCRVPVASFGEWVWLYFRHLLNQTEPLSSSQNPSKGPVRFLVWQSLCPAPKSLQRTCVSSPLGNKRAVLLSLQGQILLFTILKW